MNNYQSEFDAIKRNEPFQKLYEWVHNNVEVGDIWVNNKSGIQVTIDYVGWNNFILKREMTNKKTSIQKHYFASDYSPIKKNKHV